MTISAAVFAVAGAYGVGAFLAGVYLASRAAPSNRRLFGVRACS
jgi:hypothetical protein